MKYSIESLKSLTFQKEDFIFFWGHHKKNEEITKSCLSQWYDSTFIHENIKYLTAEHWMMAEKARLFNDKENFELIIKSNHPSEVKKLGRQIKNFNPELWNENKYKIVIEGNFLKFNQNKDLKNFLLQTGNKVLVEASPEDKIWGIGLSENDPDIYNIKNWKGENLLGFSLMEVRDRLKD
ncbi:MAG: NADAR family protein [Leptospiraceae bacterium]|nr:NADAR family protein [Leptospiraceae bacterium]